jgi:FkbM family methyltransferase
VNEPIQTITRLGLTIQCVRPIHFDDATAVISQYTGPLDRVVDIGACIGGLSMYAAVNGAKEVLAFEPDPETFRLLSNNVHVLNRLTPPVQAMQAAVVRDDQADELYTVRHASSGQTSAIYATSMPGQGSMVPTIPTSMIFEREIDYLKIDVEGAEYTFANPKFFRSLRKVGFIDIEVHPLNPNYFDLKSPLLLPEYGNAPERADIILPERIQRMGFEQVYMSGSRDTAINYGFRRIV